MHKIILIVTVKPMVLLKGYLSLMPKLINACTVRYEQVPIFVNLCLGPNLLSNQTKLSA